LEGHKRGLEVRSETEKKLETSMQGRDVDLIGGMSILFEVLVARSTDAEHGCMKKKGGL
jgi:hypothetical protein